MPNPSPFKRGCGCLLLILGAVLISAAVIFALASYVADEHAGKENEAQWEVYNQQIAALDSIADEAVRDSIAQELPAPHIRQGGFATLFGFFFGFIIVVIALIPLGIGTYLYVKNKKLRT